MSIFVIAANAARWSGSAMERWYRPRPAEPSAGVRSARYEAPTQPTQRTSGSLRATGGGTVVG